MIVIFVIIVGSMTNPMFTSGRNIGNLIEQAMALGIVSLGEMLVILLGGIDLSVGAVISMTTTILAYPFSENPSSIAINIMIALAAGVLVGCFNGIGIVKFKIPAFIMTLSTMCIVNGIALQILPVPGGSIPYEFSTLLNGRMGIFPHVLILYIILFIILRYVLKRKRLGRNIYAIGGNRAVSDLSGIKSGKVVFLCYILTSVFAVIAGVYISARMGTGDPTMGSQYSLDAITVCVLAGVNLFGGRGNIITLPAATMILCMMSNILNMIGVQSYYQYVLKGVILLITVLIYSLRDRNKN